MGENLFGTTDSYLFESQLLIAPGLVGTGNGATGEGRGCTGYCGGRIGPLKRPLASFARIDRLASYLPRFASPPANPIGSSLIHLPTAGPYHLFSRSDMSMSVSPALRRGGGCRDDRDGPRAPRSGCQRTALIIGPPPYPTPDYSLGDGRCSSPSFSPGPAAPPPAPVGRAGCVRAWTS